jgi:hypothetical protein
MPSMRGLLVDTYRTFSRRGGRILGGAIAFYSLATRRKLGDAAKARK